MCHFGTFIHNPSNTKFFATYVCFGNVMQLLVVLLIRFQGMRITKSGQVLVPQTLIQKFGLPWDLKLVSK